MQLVDDNYKALLDRSMRHYYIKTLGASERQFKVAAQQRYDMARGKSIAALLEEQLDLAGCAVLDVGSGWGEVAYVLRQHGVAQVFGVEPDVESLEVARALMRSGQMAPQLINSAGEDLPFADGSFDVVICHHVIEHVQSPAKVIAELMRVTRRGGHILLAFPNYAFPFEGHYRLPWLPFMPKQLGRLYLKLLGRDPDYLMHYVNYVTYRNVLKMVRKYPVRLRSLTEERRRGARRGSSLPARAYNLLLDWFKLYPTVSFLLTRL